MHRHVARFTAIMALACAVAGCSAGSNQLAVGSTTGPTVAFDSVDGPPPEVFDRLVRALETESASRSLAIVSREAPASYRVRSYMSAQVRRGKTTIAWVWDVYDRDQQRALRLSGEETAGKAGRDAWSAADDRMMARIAQAGLNGVNGLVRGVAPEDAPRAPPAAGPAIALTDTPNEPNGTQISALAFGNR